MDFLKPLLPHPEGYRFILIFAALTALLFPVETALGWIGVVLTAACVWFFRDPERITPQRSGLVISPADGKIVNIDEAAPPPELGLGAEPRPRISVFLSVLDCHINRSPVAGTIRRILYRTGRFFDARLDKASDDNERQTLVIDMEDGRDIIVVQIAGLIARRIVSFVSEEQAIASGERFGMIRFGSRCDIYLPSGTTPLVAVGQTAVGGETVLADFASDEAARETLAS